MTEKLTACRDCEHSIPPDGGGPNAASCMARGSISVFNCWNGRWTPYEIVPVACKVNTGEGPCNYFKAKP